MLGRWAAPAALLVALAVVLFAPATLGGKVLSASDMPLFQAPFAPPPGQPQNALQYDSGFVFEPDGLQVRTALRDLRLPVWTPYLSAGRPLLATQQSAPLFPLTWIGAVFPYWESLAWIAVLKLALAGLGTVVLARMLGLGSGAALLGGIAFAFNSYLVDWLMLAPEIYSSSYQSSVPLHRSGATDAGTPWLDIGLGVGSAFAIAGAVGFAVRSRQRVARVRVS